MENNEITDVNQKEDQLQNNKSPRMKRRIQKVICLASHVSSQIPPPYRRDPKKHSNNKFIKRLEIQARSLLRRSKEMNP